MLDNLDKVLIMGMKLKTISLEAQCLNEQESIWMWGLRHKGWTSIEIVRVTTPIAACYGESYNSYITYPSKDSFISEFVWSPWYVKATYYKKTSFANWKSRDDRAKHEH